MNAITASNVVPFLLCLSRPHCSFMGMMISHDMLLGRWRLSLELFGRVFMEDVGAEPGSVYFYLNIHLKVVFIST